MEELSSSVAITTTTTTKDDGNFGSSSKINGNNLKGKEKKIIVRNRQIYSCKRCYSGKRKCDKQKESCTRCRRANVKCEYFKTISPKRKGKMTKNTLAGEDARFKNTNGVSTTNGQVKPSLENILNTEINPQLSKQENHNFTLIISSTGEYSKFFPICMYPFHDHEANVALLTKFNDVENRSVSVFDFSIIVHPIRSLDKLKSKIPRKEVSDFLVDHFFKYIVPFVPIVDFQEFVYDYQVFLSDPGQYRDEKFLVVFFAIIFCSCTNMMFLQDLRAIGHYNRMDNSEMMEEDFKQLRSDCFECIENIKQILNSDATPSMSVIVSLALIYYVGSSNGYLATMQISSLVKYSQIFGLHRKLQMDTNTLPMRDIIYNFVWYLDGLAAYYSGLPPNMHNEIFQSDHTNLQQSNDINILFFAGRLQNTKVWNRILFQFNKINKPKANIIDEIASLYYDSILIVNSINIRIMECDHTCERFKKWLITETRMGLRKSALLLNALKCSMSYKQLSSYNKNITTELVLQSMLLINESIYKVKLGVEVMQESIWFYRFAIPFQAMYIVLSHIQRYPKKGLNFSMISEELNYTSESEYQMFDLTRNDIRFMLVDESIKTLRFLVNFWPTSNIDRFENIIKFRNYVFENLKEESSPDSDEGNIFKFSNSPSGSNIDVTSKNTDFEKIITGLEDPSFIDRASYDAYAFLEEGSKFWFGDAY